MADHVQLKLPYEPGAALEPVEQQEMWSASFGKNIKGSAAAQVRMMALSQVTACTR